MTRSFGNMVLKFNKQLDMSFFTLLIFIILIIIPDDFILLNVYSLGEDNNNNCPPEERMALLKFRATVSDPSGRLSSWTGEDCCTWLGVSCDPDLGHVTFLDLSPKPQINAGSLRGKTLDSSLSELKYLSYLDLSENDFQLSPIPDSFGSMSQLRTLILGQSNLSGPIPLGIGNLSSLTHFFLYDNQLSGEIPVSLGQLSNLEILDLSSNSLNGTISEAHFANLSKLSIFNLRDNPLTIRIRSDYTAPFQLRAFEMSSCEIFGGQFPPWLQKQYELHFLTLTNCGISGSLPKWAYNASWTELHLAHNRISGPIPQLPSFLYYLNISHNRLSGPIPTIIGLRSMLLAQNLINGTISDSFCEMKRLYAVDLSRNRLSGDLPNCWEKMEELTILKLSANELSGVLPWSIGGARSLRWLHLNSNSFAGEIPSDFRNLSNLLVMDIGDNKFSGELPEWIGLYLPRLLILRVRNNNFTGAISSELCRLSRTQIIDAANNGLRGEIPDCFGNLKGMVERKSMAMFDFAGADVSMIMVIKGLQLEYTKTLQYLVNLDLSGNNLSGGIPGQISNLHAVLSLNLSHNHFTGNIPGKIGDMKSLESLDLSNNDLFGKIPDSLSRLSSLSRLNFSYNNLSGEIPTGRQLQTLDDPSIYDGNPLLCGAPLLRSCDNKLKPDVEPAHDEEEEDDDGVEKVWFYGVIITGFATGFWAFFGVLIFRRKWRHAYFIYLEFKLHQLFGI